jgi:hypothetical protein
LKIKGGIYEMLAFDSGCSGPDAVLKGFIKNYGDAEATWKVTEGNYEATFKLIGMPATA